MALDACIRAIHYGMQGIVMCFNADDLGIDVEALQAIVRRVEPKFEILLPLRKVSGKKVRASLKKDGKLRHVSCMHSENCGYCAKCLRKY